jgi:transcriptional regulator with XRE-family HTH domain
MDLSGKGKMQTTAWRYADNTGSSMAAVSRSGSIGVAAAVAFAFLAGTGGVTSPSFFNERQEQGYGFVQLRPTGQSLVRRLRGTEGNLAQIRAVFKPSISDIGSIFGVSRQSVYNWLAGERPSQESAEKLDDLARAADLFLADGVANSSYLFRRKLENGKTLMDIIRDGGSAQNAARSLLQIAQRETSQREALQRRLANRATTAPDYSNLGSQMLNEDLG